jgi:hypothetical protein
MKKFVLLFFTCFCFTHLNVFPMCHQNRQEELSKDANKTRRNVKKHALINKIIQFIYIQISQLRSPTHSRVKAFGYINE